MRKRRIGTAKFFTLLVLLYHTSAKAQELQHNIHVMRSKGDNPTEHETALKRINKLIKAYEEIVEGNYIDNLIKAQKSREAAAQRSEKSPKHKR